MCKKYLEKYLVKMSESIIFVISKDTLVLKTPILGPLFHTLGKEKSLQCCNLVLSKIST